MPCLNSPFVLMSAFEEFVSGALCMLYMRFFFFFYGEGGKEISLPGAHHAVCLEMKRSSQPRTDVYSEFLLFLCYQSS